MTSENKAAQKTRAKRPGRLALAALASLLAGAMAPQMAGAHEKTAPDPATICEAAAIHHERDNELPRALLAAVAMAESGRSVPGARTARAWPWTINAEGRPYYFKTKDEAIAKTQQLLDGGMRSIDVGCMQVNLRYHPQAFASLDDAFDPMTNVAYGAEFLMRLRERTGSWQQAVAHYHSQTEWRGGRYFARVIRIWKNERTRIANASYTIAAQDTANRIDVTSFLKPAILHNAAEVTTHTITASADYRPAPKVLDTAPNHVVRANAAVGLRLSIAEDDVAKAVAVAAQEAPRVLEPRPALSNPTQMAEATIPSL
jgi:soluble lytic murein transglycosylase-like protein